MYIVLLKTMFQILHDRQKLNYLESIVASDKKGLDAVKVLISYESNHGREKN